MPLFLSAETIRAELAARIESATGRATRIDGPISFSVIPTARLSAEGVGIAGLASDTEAFSVESVSFGLSLLPLLTGTIDIYGVTITRPSILIETDAGGYNNWSGPATANETTPANIEELIATGQGQVSQSENAAGDAIAALDRLSIGRVTIANGTLIWRDRSSGREERIEALDLDIRVPRLDSAGTVKGSFTRLGVAQSLELDIGERPDPTRFESIPVALTLASEGGTVVAQGTAVAGETLFNGTIDSEGGSFLQFARGFGIDLPRLPVFAAFATTARINATASQIRIEDYSVDLNGLAARGGAAIGLDRVRPGIGLKIAAERIDTALFVAEPNDDGSGATQSGAAGNAGDGAIDFSPLGLVDANIDFSAKEILVGAVPVTDFGMDIQIVNGGITGNIRSATVNGAPGNGTFAVDTSGAVPAISGDVEMSGLDAVGLIALSGMDLPVQAGTIGVDVAFSTRGGTQAALIENLDGNGRVSLVNGRVADLQLADLVGGDTSANQVDEVDVVAEFSSLNGPIEAKGGFGWRGERFTISARGDPRALAAGRATPIAINADSNVVDFGFAGDASTAGLGGGSVSLSTPSLRNLLAWVGQPLAAGTGLGPFSIEGAVSLSDDSFAFEKANFTLDGSSGIGTGKVVFGDKPQVSAGLSMSRLDVTPYMGTSGTASRGGGAGGNTSGGAGGWGTEQISFAGLRAIDANFNFKADEIVADQITIGPSLLTAQITGGKLSAELTEMALYSGIGVGTLSVDGSTATPAIEAFFRLDGIEALPFLRDAAGFSRIEGTGSVSFDIRASGDSEAALMAGLDGKGAIDFRDGAIRGINIPKMVRGLSIDTLLGWQQSENEKTDFSQLSANYTIERGILTNNDLIVVGPLLRMTGAGTVDIPNRSLSYRVDPKIVASLEGQGASEDLEGFAVPIRIEGPWSQPRIYPEIEGILQDPQGALDQLRKLGGGLFGGTGGQQGPADGSSGQGVGDLLSEGVSQGLGNLLGTSDSNTPSAGSAPPSGGLENLLSDGINKGLGGLFGGSDTPPAESQTPAAETPPIVVAPPVLEAPTTTEAPPAAEAPAVDAPATSETAPTAEAPAAENPPVAEEPAASEVQPTAAPSPAEAPAELAPPLDLVAPAAPLPDQPAPDATTTPEEPGATDPAADLLKSLLGQ